MMQKWTPALLLCAGCTLNPPRPTAKCDSPVAPEQPAVIPQVDHHQHLLSEGARDATVDHLRTIDTAYSRIVAAEPVVDADQLDKLLDEAGIPKALVFSNAYYFSRFATEQPGEYERVKAENDWTLAQIARHPTRFYAACSVNPRRGHAAAEIERCAASGRFKAIKIHFDASGVDLTNAEHVASVRRAFATANRVRLPIVVHLQSEAGPYGGQQTRTFLNEIMTEARNVPVTVNHLWGGGVYGRGPAEVLSVFAEAFARKDPSTSNLWFDLAQASMMVVKDKDRTQLVDKMRQIGLARMLYGSDGPQWSGVPPKQHLEEFSSCMPLTHAELRTVATNVAPYLR